MSLHSLFTQPFPYSGRWQSRLGMSLYFGGFVFLFLFLFRPFGLDLVPVQSAFFNALVYGMICWSTVLAGTLLIPLLSPTFFSEEKWTTGRQMFFVLLIVFLVGLANYGCSVLLMQSRWNWQQFAWFQGITLGVSLPPLFVLTLVRQSQLLRQYREKALGLEHKLQEKLLWQEKLLVEQQGQAAALQLEPMAALLPSPSVTTHPAVATVASTIPGDASSSVDAYCVATSEASMAAVPASRLSVAQPVIVTICGDYQNESLTVAIDKLYLIQSANNYIKVYFEEKGKVGYSIIRLTLKRAEELLAGHAVFFRCHRATIINLDKVAHIEGNAQGYKIQFPGIEESIAVSRGLSTEFTDRLLAIRKEVSL